MVIRDSQYPRLPRMYWGELIYATPGCGKTYVANKYRDVVDGDDLIVKAISEVSPEFDHGYYDDPRKVIHRYFRYIHFNPAKKWRMYKAALRKMNKACSIDDVVLFGTLDLMHEADRIFLEKDTYYVREGFEEKQDREEEKADDLEEQVPVHNIYEYLDNSLQRICSS
mmetsp:Transcript_30056/g.36676  ORF Transcript_30056/g.36676 Transcript_30056/m.36676 type:complete len:168 (-) Transcript_30056:156-659(-)|eukprot:CAMPEP_0172505152 /NCGR_PEP_ID=MMETSP1066-20121228/184050_1 /TAXON_ID=671091 /ORGANISM="Coscinodiscus wailesii, Strain CCMP2513" /LENGTH=167 /DNA_ID=CAMNT_0013281645 /DNA_START=146 /DNA_END=649 /DNA_ORIENTATION=-